MKLTKLDLAVILVNDVLWDGEKNPYKLAKMYSWKQLNDAVDILFLKRG